MVETATTLATSIPTILEPLSSSRQALSGLVPLFSRQALSGQLLYLGGEIRCDGNKYWYSIPGSCKRILRVSVEDGADDTSFMGLDFTES
jgi:hypothetical protein